MSDDRHPLEDSTVGLDPVHHPHYVRCMEALCGTTVDMGRLTLVLGLAGAGKSFLGHQLVRERNEAPVRGCAPVRDADRLSAAMVTAPASQRGAFSWKALWVRVLRALEDPLCGSKMDREAKAHALRSGAKRARPHSEAEYFDAVRDAARDRGFSLLVIDEAYSLTRADRERTLLDQLDVLRELADVGLSVVLLSTFRIMERIVISGEVDRRMTHIVLPHYAGSSECEADAKDYENFCGVVATFMGLLPPAYAMRLGKRGYRRLYNGSLGCVGLLSDWFNRAIERCVRERPVRALEWRDFEGTALPQESRCRMVRSIEEACRLEALLDHVDPDV